MRGGDDTGPLRVVLIRGYNARDLSFRENENVASRFGLRRAV